MNCPHCNEEGLLGAKTCLACGRSMLTAPPPAAEPAPAPAASDPPDRALVQALCKACLQGFERAESDAEQVFCPGCRQFSPVAGGDVGESDVVLHPATAAAPGVDPRAGGAVRPWRPVRRRASLRLGPVVAVAGLVIGLGTMGVVTFVNRETDPAERYLERANRDATKIFVAPSQTDVVRLESAMTLRLTHEVMRDNFANRTETVLDLTQKNVQTADVAWVRDDPRGVVLDSAGECRVAQQSGRAPGTDGRDARAYPWEGHRETARLVVSGSEATQFLGGADAVPGRDFIPCLTVRDIGAPADAVAAGRSWQTDVLLPLGVGRDGAVRAVAFPCSVTFGGRVTRNGLSLHVFSLRGSAPRSAAEICDEMNRSDVTIRGALLYDAATGLLAEAHLTASVAAWLERGRVEDLVRLSGALDVKRR